MNKERIVGTVPEVPERKNPSYPREWKDVMTLPGAQDILDPMVADDEHAEYFFEKRLHTFVFDTASKGAERMTEMRNLFSHQLEALEEVRAVIGTANTEAGVSMATFSSAIWKNRFFLPNQLTGFLQSAFRRPLIGEHAFDTRERMIGEELTPNENYTLTNTEQGDLRDSLDVLIARHKRILDEFNPILKLKDFTTKVGQLSKEIDRPEEENRAA